MIAAGGIDAVTITTPPDTRRELVLDAIAAGLHVVADKPFAPSAEAARKLGAAAKAKGVFLGVYHNCRWDADFRTLRSGVCLRAGWTQTNAVGREGTMTEIAVFGAGCIGEVYALNAAALLSVRVRYLVDPVAGAQRDDLAKRFGAEIVDPDAVFADPAIGGVVIASSTDTHAVLLERAVAAGKPVFC